jgi:hypothetical protein
MLSRPGRIGYKLKNRDNKSGACRIFVIEVKKSPGALAVSWGGRASSRAEERVRYLVPGRHITRPAQGTHRNPLENEDEYEALSPGS